MTNTAAIEACAHAWARDEPYNGRHLTDAEQQLAFDRMREIYEGLSEGLTPRQPRHLRLV